MIDPMDDSIFDQGDSIVCENKSYGAVPIHRTQPVTGPAPRVAYVQHQPSDNMLSAVLTTVFCFFPLGCLSIYYSFRTRDMYQQGNLRASLNSAKHSKTMSQMAMVVGVMLWFSGALTILLRIENII